MTVAPAVLERILPDAVVAEECFGDPPVPPPLFDEEAALVARVVDRRRREFTTVRDCARRAMLRLGQSPAPVLPGDRGAPVWPPGVVGSMTHCDGYRAAALALDSQIRTIGVDAEPNLSLPDGVLGKVAGPDERAALSGYAAVDPGVNWDRLLFCAKEAVYKAWFPLARRWLGFLDAHVVFDPREGTFVARLLVSPPLLDGRPLEGFTGRWHSGAGLLLAAIAVPPVPV